MQRSIHDILIAHHTSIIAPLLAIACLFASGSLFVVFLSLLALFTGLLIAALVFVVRVTLLLDLFKQPRLSIFTELIVILDFRLGFIFRFIDFFN